jgi:hypothetical protein
VVGGCISHRVLLSEVIEQCTLNFVENGVFGTKSELRELRDQFAGWTKLYRYESFCISSSDWSGVARS